MKCLDSLQGFHRTLLYGHKPIVPRQYSMQGTAQNMLVITVCDCFTSALFVVWLTHGYAEAFCLY